jgi:MOSC domain-containing protein YiiM
MSHVHDVDVLLDSTGPLDQSFRACLASVLEVPLDDIPPPCADLASTTAVLRTWLAGRGFGLVPVANPSRFQWAGYWLAVAEPPGGTSQQFAVLMFGTPPGVVLSPQDPALLGRSAAALGVQQGFVVAPLDPVRRRPDRVTSSLVGRVEVVAVAPRAEASMRQVTSALALPGRGLDGDRYAEHAGTFTPRHGPGTGHDLTLIEAEVLDDLDLGGEGRLGYLEARRNLVTRGVDLNSLVGRRFVVGDVECVGRRLCEPCAHLERLTYDGVLRALIHRGGLRADILTGGTISQGDAVEAVDAGDGDSSPRAEQAQR